MSEFHPPNDDKSVTQSEALPTMGGDSHPNDGDMNHNDSSNNYEVLANTTSNTHHHPPHPEEVAAPWGSNPSTNMAYSNPHHRAPPPPPPPPHGSYHHPPPHEPHHHPHHGGYHPPYGSSPHYAYPPHDSHYHPPPPHYPPPPPHHPSVHHYPPKYSHHPHSSQMYHHPGYYQHPPPPPPHYHHHHYPPQHHQQHGMPPHGSYPPPPHYSSVPPQDVSPHNHRDDTHHVNESVPPKQPMNNPTEQQQYNPLPSQQVNMVTPTINSATTPGVTNATNYSPNTTSPPIDNHDSNATTQDDIMNSPATKELFASTPHHLSTNPTTTSTTNSGGGNFNRSGMYKQRKQHQAVHKSILSKGLLPLDYDKNDDLVICGFEDSLLLPVARYDDGRVEEDEELGRHQHGGVASNISSVAATAANTAAQLSGGGSTYTSSQSTTSEPIIAGVSGTTNMVTSPHQMEEIKSLSNQARAQIAKMKRMGKKQVQQVESQRVADIACEDNERYASADDESSNNVDATCGDESNLEVGTRGDATTTAEQYTTIKTPKKSSTTQQKRYKDKDGFIYYRRVGNKHYKKLFEKGLVPKGDDGDSEDAKVVERVNAIQTITTTDGVFVEEVPVVHQPEGEEDIGGVLNRRGLEERVEEGEGEVVEESMKQHQNLQLPRSRQTQLLYCNQQKRPVNASDGYELRVVPHEDGNDFHVELIKPDAEKVESVKPSAEEKDVEGATSPSSSPSVESEKLSENVEEGTAGGGSKKNVGEFVSAVDSILDAAETIAKRDTPRSSPVTLPQSQHQQTENFALPGISSLTKRKCADMIQGYQEEKRQRSNSSVAFNPCTYSAPSTFSYPPPDTVRPSPPHERVAEPSPQSHAAGPASNHTYSQIICQDRKEKRGRRTYCYPHPSVDLTEYYSSRQVTKTKKEELTALALCAASHIQKEPVLFRAILLNMALERERDSPKRHSGGAPTHLKNLALKRLSSQNLDGSATDTAFMSAVESSGKKVIRDGFFWKDVPELEKVLQTHMMEYYFMSENRPQSKKQQQFNNRLVSLVYQEAIARGFVFDPVSFSLEGHGPLDFPSTTTPIECAGNWIVPPGFNHKKLRDRIRCYYKTHVQNSKKRLGTLLKNPIKERNRDILLRLVNELKSQEHVELSPECGVALKRLKAEQDSIKGTVSTPDATSPSSYEISSHPSAGYIGDHSQQTTTPYSSRATISDGGSGSSSSTSHSVQPASTTFSPFKHASLLSSMRQLDSQRH
eukprot:scaffold1868_cov139-Skeletonema_dohrnii-CCMP3373.AAC.6